MELLQGAFIYLMAAVIAVPIANRLGLGSVLGYLIAGILIGPAFGLVGGETEDLKHFAEFGVVMMLFLVGLELQPAMLWRMKDKLLGLGGLQVTGTIALFAAIAMAFGLSWQNALTVGMILALSSTAIVLQTLNEKGLMKSTGGQSSFSVLLFQDIAVIPMLALMPLLATAVVSPSGDDGHHGSMIGELAGWLQGLIIMGVIVGIIVAGRYVIQPVFRFIAEAKLREIFTAAALLLVIGIALLMSAIGLSPALGTFLAGVVLSSSEYRHELESDIDPFKGLLLGLFFITVGAGIDFDLLAAQPLLIVGLALGVMVLKFGVLFLLGTFFKLPKSDRFLFSSGLAQAGEFAFVLFGFATASGALPSPLVQTLTLVVAITMLLTPALFILYEKLVLKKLSSGETRDADEIDEKGTAVIAGSGRFGQIVARLLMSNNHKVVILDHDPQIVDVLGRSGIKAFYGDATRPDLLHASGLDEAKLFVACLDDKEKQNTLVHHVAKHYPHVRIIARAVDRHHVYELEQLGAHVIERELFEGSLNVGRKALVELGHHPYQAEQKARMFTRHDLKSFEAAREQWSADGASKKYTDVMRAHTEELFEIMSGDKEDLMDKSEKGWLPPPKEYTAD
ncbi:monovalent cation:proton antiporter-2 (CPA2) family protein [Terasakiella sp. A23]|uniref:monovalent cation:proton antiporter-2 (CPA2) family protein n=1 Tax=Terasakiella sp. FCG-A23 TaxID=3080561 RepID=UPI002952F0BE|nr:monovalent cation:proton antiporter-2 (CPA2) family protein [Terasakiella sp. A23]MDV7341046.1 monovalent cation:proton antiporter-2 (CPA2) family protein [Terasakiella sp. A23]